MRRAAPHTAQPMKPTSDEGGVKRTPPARVCDASCCVSTRRRATCIKGLGWAKLSRACLGCGQGGLLKRFSEDHLAAQAAIQLVVQELDAKRSVAVRHLEVGAHVRMHHQAARRRRRGGGARECHAQQQPHGAPHGGSTGSGVQERGGCPQSRQDRSGLCSGIERLRAQQATSTAPPAAIRAACSRCSDMLAQWRVRQNSPVTPARAGAASRQPRYRERKMYIAVTPTRGLRNRRPLTEAGAKALLHNSQRRSRLRVITRRPPCVQVQRQRGRTRGVDVRTRAALRR